MIQIDARIRAGCAIWMRPRSSSPMVPMYLVRRPSRAQAAMALATWPPGLMISSSKGNFAGVSREIGALPAAYRWRSGPRRPRRIEGRRHWVLMLELAEEDGYRRRV